MKRLIIALSILAFLGGCAGMGAQSAFPKTARGKYYDTFFQSRSFVINGQMRSRPVIANGIEQGRNRWTGKMLILKASNGAFHKEYFTLPSDVRATSQEELKTLVFTQIVDYGDSVDYLIHIFDLKKKDLIVTIQAKSWDGDVTSETIQKELPKVWPKVKKYRSKK